MQRLMRDACGETQVRAAMETQQGYDEDLWQQLSQMGITGLMIAEDFGGSGVGPMELEAVMEEAGAALLSAPILASSVIAAELIRSLGDDDFSQRLLPQLASGAMIATAVLGSDGGRWDPQDIGITARQVNGDWQLNGLGNYVLHGQNANVLIVIADVAGSLCAFEVDVKQPGLVIEALPTFDRTLRLAKIDFAAVSGHRINHTNDVSQAVRQALDLGLVGLAGEQSGGANKVLQDTVEYAKTRIQFGRQIGSFQAIKHMAAELLVETESAISAARDAAAALAQDRADKDQAISLAAFACADAYVRTTADSVQMHGGIAFTWEHPTHLYLRRARANAQLLGDSDHHRERYLQALGA